MRASQTEVPGRLRAVQPRVFRKPLFDPEFYVHPRLIQYGLWLALSAPFAAQAQTQSDLSKLDAGMVGPRTQVWVLGTVHLSQIAELRIETLDPVLDRLAAFKPQIITIEAIPGESCDLAARHPSVYGPDFCLDTDAAKAATGLDVPAAIAAIDKSLRDWPAQPEPAQRRHLAALFLAANDRASAYVQWLQLPENQRRTGDGLDEALVALLNKTATRNNENFLLGSRLAARLGLQRVYPVDDHSGDNVVGLPDKAAFGQAIEQAWKNGRGELDRVERHEDELRKTSDMLALYRFLNRADNLSVFAQANVGAVLREPSREHYPQIWVAGWEIRNLRMVANIQQTFRERPGARVLSIVGATHKPWLDQWLGQMQGVDIVDAQQQLK
ncbi:MAG: DUF5694 domain-containing protein [Lysobacter sp.]